MKDIQIASFFIVPAATVELIKALRNCENEKFNFIRARTIRLSGFQQIFAESPFNEGKI